MKKIKKLLKVLMKKQLKEYKTSFFCKNNSGDNMEKTGMTRRIDELGRLVIPKEIRKSLRIKDNDQVEISVVDNKILLSKYESITKNEVISNLLNCLKKKIKNNVYLTSRDKIIDYSLINKENNFVLNEDIMNIIENRKDKINDVDMCSVFPLIVNGDVYGSLIISSDKEIYDIDIAMISLCKMFLENYLE